MDLALWVLAWLLAGVFAGAGLYKLLLPNATITANPNHGWMHDFMPVQLKLIGLVEVLGAVGLVVPPLLGVAEWLVPLAAAGLALDMLGAFSTHLRRSDPVAQRVPPVVLGTLAVVVAVGRYWIQPF